MKLKNEFRISDCFLVGKQGINILFSFKVRFMKFSHVTSKYPSQTYMSTFSHAKKKLWKWIKPVRKGLTMCSDHKKQIRFLFEISSVLLLY